MTSMLDHKELVKPTAFKKEIDRHEKKTIDTYASISTSNTSETILELLNKADSRERASQLLEKLEQERHAWEGEEFAASHKRLYAILTQCYFYYIRMKSESTPKKIRTEMMQGLDNFISAKGLKTLSGTHDINRVVKAIFGEDRRRVSAYASALRVALVSGVTSIDGTTRPVDPPQLSEWITKQGGVEEIRKASTKEGVPTADRVETAKAAIQDSPLMTFKPNTGQLKLDTDDVDKMMVLIVTYRPTGELEVNSVIKKASVVDAALTAHYADNIDAMTQFRNASAPAQPSAVSLALNNN